MGTGARRAVLAALVAANAVLAGCSTDSDALEGFDSDQLAGLGPADPSPLENAAARGDVARVEDLLVAGTDPTEGVYASPLFGVVDSDVPTSRAHEIVEVLLDHGADVDVGGLSASNQTPLHRAALRDRASLVVLLLEHGADPCRRVTRGDAFRWMTALDIARERGNTQAEEVLEGPAAACS